MSDLLFRIISWIESGLGGPNGIVTSARNYFLFLNLRCIRRWLGGPKDFAKFARSWFLLLNAILISRGLGGPKGLATFVRKCFLFLILTISTFGCKPQFYQGEAIYQKQCSNCHGSQGEGLKSLYPPLKNADYLSTHAAELPCIIRYGITDTLIVNGKMYTTPMAGFPKLSEVDLTNLVNYLLAEFTSENVVVGLSEVKNKLDRCN